MWSNCKCATVCFHFGWANISDKHGIFAAFNNPRGHIYATLLLVVYSRNLVALWSNQFEINKIWQSSQPKKAQTLNKKKRTLVVSPEGTLIPSILLPAHFMLCSALIDVKIVLQIQEYQYVCLCVCLFACSTHLLICVCVCVSMCYSCVFLLLYFNASSILVRWTSCLNCIWAPVQPGHMT